MSAAERYKLGNYSARVYGSNYYHSGDAAATGCGQALILVALVTIACATAIFLAI